MSDATHGDFVWYDLMTRDLQAAVEFYTHVVGWTAEAYPGSTDYILFAGSAGPLGGTAPLQESARKMGAPPHWGSNVFVDDVDGTATLARELGGRVLVEPKDFPGVGRLAVLADPQGAVINVFKPRQAMKLHDPGKPGEIAWCELMTTDHRAAFAFYGRLFGWTTSREVDVPPIGPYLVYAKDGRDLGGMFTMPASASIPAAWLHYIEVAGLDAALDRARARGATVMNGPVEAPGGSRFVQLLDPQGAAFALHERGTSR